jgi:hypothetical protein
VRGEQRVDATVRGTRSTRTSLPLRQSVVEVRIMGTDAVRTLAIALVGVSMAMPLDGQIVRGTVVDDSTEVVLEGATVALMGPAGAGLSAVTDSAGRFTLSGRGVGEYSLHVTRIGYRAVTTPSLVLDRSDTIDVAIRVAVEAIPVAPLTITARGGPATVDARLKRWGYYDRQAEYSTLSTGNAHFLDIEYIRRRAPSRVTDLFRDLHGVRPVNSGPWATAPQTTRGCRMAVYIDGIKMRRGELDEWVPVSSLAAIEVYPGAPYPLQYAPGVRECGSVVVWTGLVADKGGG